ncbi:TM2 domain-containing protein [Pusillimonas sp. 7-48]|uniref:TM2 domain-containing protein n=2 Tax=Pusillimonas minor TaxID=2697024 RepID=A0A842HN80_9BURK|nr:TM2 domain-containing protein [Pusillimonas minor]
MQMKQHRSKVIVSLLAAVLGVFGAHWWYLRRPYAWLFTLVTLGLLAYAQTFPSWWDNPAFLLLFIPMAAGCIEALVFCLKPDAWFDARYNPGASIQTQTGWGPVLVAILTVFLGGTVVVFGIAATVVHVYTALGWLDGYQL